MKLPTNIDSYRDGGTVVITYSGKEYYVDRRCAVWGTPKLGQWTFNFPGKGDEEPVPEEKISEIRKSLENMYELSLHALRSCMGENYNLLDSRLEGIVADEVSWKWLAPSKKEDLPLPEPGLLVPALNDKGEFEFALFVATYGQATFFKGKATYSDYNWSKLSLAI